MYLLSQEGKKPGEMNKLTKKMGFPVGSATLMDKVGIDVAAKISEYLGKEFGSRLGDSAAMVSILKEMVSKGMLGKCVGNNLYIMITKKHHPQLK